jgi:hypothetical protein
MTTLYKSAPSAREVGPDESDQQRAIVRGPWKRRARRHTQPCLWLLRETSTAAVPARIWHGRLPVGDKVRDSGPVLVTLAENTNTRLAGKSAFTVRHAC